MMSESKPEGVILAAGYSSRAGTFKMTLPYGEKTLLNRAIDGMSAVCSGVVVVGGHDIERIAPIVAAYDAVSLVFNDQYPLGMFSSVLTGVRHLQGNDFFIMPGDYPFVPPSVYRSLLAALKAADSGSTIFIPVFNGRKGHPVLFAAGLRDLLLKEPVDTNLKAFIDKIGFQTVAVPHEGILIDIDTPADYRQTEKASKAIGSHL